MTIIITKEQKKAAYEKMFRIFYVVVLLALVCFALTGCMDSEMTSSEIESSAEVEGAAGIIPWEHIGASFEWFFGNFTPAYWKSSQSAWDLLSLAQECWEIPSLIGFVFAVLMNAVVFIIALIVTLLMACCYVLALVLFVAVFIILIAVTIIALLIALVSFGLLSI